MIADSDRRRAAKRLGGDRKPQPIPYHHHNRHNRPSAFDPGGGVAYTSIGTDRPIPPEKLARRGPRRALGRRMRRSRAAQMP